MKRYNQGIKKRREERLRLLKNKQRKYGGTEENSTFLLSPRGQRESVSTPTWSSFNEEYPPAYKVTYERNRQTLKVILRIICALILVTAVYIIMRSESPQLRATQDFVQEVMSRDFNVQGVMSWYEKNLGTEPAFLPKIIKVDKEERVPQPGYVIPVTGGLVVSPFGQDQQGIKVKTVSTQMPIEVVKEGWVVFVGEKEGLGETVIIDHLNGEESWYGDLQDIQVRLHDWVDQGEKLGYSTPIEENSRQGIFYFALKKDSVFIDPLGVISFD